MDCKLFTCLLFFLCLNVAQSRDLVACQDQSKPGTSVFDQYINGRTGQVLNVRIPSSGLLNEPISCILVTDLANSKSEPIIREGGVGFYYAVIHIEPGFLESLKYEIQVYT